MRNLHRLIAYVLIIGLVLTVAYVISAQQEGERRQRPGQRQQRRQMDPAAMIERMVERTMRELTPSKEETAILKPMIEGILRTRMEQNRETRQLIDDLRKAIEAKDNTQITAKLTEVKAKRKEHRANAEKLEKELVELLSLKQEAQLTVLGIVNSDGMGGFFGGFRGRQQRPGQQQQRPRRGQQ